MRQPSMRRRSLCSSVRLFILINKEGSVVQGETGETSEGQLQNDDNQEKRRGAWSGKGRGDLICRPGRAT